MSRTIDAHTTNQLIAALEQAAHMLRWEIPNAEQRGVPRHAEAIAQTADSCDAALRALDACAPRGNVIPFTNPKGAA
jgi:hypothetical protein